MTTTSSSRSSGSTPRFFDGAFLYAICGVAQAMVLWSVLVGDTGPVLALVYHAGLITLVAVILVLLVGCLETHDAIGLFLLALGGPLGAVLAVGFSSRFISSHLEPPPELLAWYDILAGRGENFAARLPNAEGEDEMMLLDPGAPTLADIVQRGSLAQKRNAIARMAAAYHRDYHPLLKSALSDPEPTIRVQAAAILTGLGHEERERLDITIENVATADQEQVLDFAEAIAQHITSCLLDAEGLRLAARALAPIVDYVTNHGSANEHSRLRMLLVWCAQSVEGDRGFVLNALLEKLVDRQMLERAS